MKTTLLGMAAVAMLFASCAKNEVNGPDNTVPDAGKINFRTSTGNVSRAVDADGTTLQNASDGFSIIAQLKDGSSYFSANETYKYDKTGAKWGFVQTAAGYDWPGEAEKYPMHFYGYFPHDLGVADLKFTPTIGATMADQKDYLFVTAEEKGKPSNGMTALKFKHILSKILFNVETKKGMTVYIQSIKIVNVAKAGQNTPSGYYYDLTKTDDNSVQVGGWTTVDAPIEGSESYAHFTGSSTTSICKVDATGITEATKAFAVAGDEVDGALMLLPQGGDNYKVWNKDAFASGYEAAKNDADQLKALMAGSYIEVVYRIVDAEGNDYIGHGGNAPDQDNPAQFVKVGYPLDLKTAANVWKMNTKYTYTIKLGTPDASNGTLIDPDFKDPDGGNTGTDVDNPEVKPGDPVSSGKIGFTVEVADWSSTPGTIK